jgi:hypothetical protein
MWDTARSMMLDLAFDSVRKMRLCQVDRYKTPLEAQLHKSLLRVKLGRRCRPNVVKDGRRKKDILNENFTLAPLQLIIMSIII